MKYTFGNYKSFRKLIVDKTSSDTLEQLVRTGDVIVPDGLRRCNIQLPSLADSHGLEIIKMDRTDGGYRISINRGAGELKGLVLSPTNTGELRIFPIADDIRSLVLTDGVADGSTTKLLSDASDWFIWTYGGRASNSSGPLIYQSPGNNSLQTRLAEEEPPAEENLGGRGRGNGGQSGGQNEPPPQRGGVSPRPAPIGEVIQEVNLLTIESIVDAEGNPYTVGEDTIASPMVTLTITGTYHSDVQRIVLWGSEQVTLGPNNTWSHDVTLNGLGRYTMTFRAFAEDAAGEVYGPEIEETLIILDAEEEVPPLLDYELIEITHVNGREWSQGIVLDPITFPATITITGNYHQNVNGLILNNRSSLGTLSHDTDALTWTYTETVNSAGDITFSFSASYEEDVETETVTLSFEEEVVETPTAPVPALPPAGISVTDLFSITEVVDSNGDPIVGGFIGSSLGVTVRGEILSANEGIFIDGVGVTVNGDSWEYTTTITETTTLSFTAVDSNDTTNVDEESVEISMASSALAPALVPQPPTVVEDPANPPALVIEESGDVVARGSQYIIDNNNFDQPIFPSYSDVFTVTINIVIPTDQTQSLRISQFTSQAYLLVDHLNSKIQICGGDFNSSLASNSAATTIIDLSNEEVTLNDGVERRYTFVFDRRWSVNGNDENSQIGSWRLYGFVGEENGPVYGSDQWSYFPKALGVDGRLLGSNITIRSHGALDTGYFTLKEFGIMLDTALTREQIEWSIFNNKTITEAFTTIPAERTTEIVSQDNMFDVAQDYGAVTTFDHGFSLRGDGGKFFPRGLRYSLMESYGRHNLGKTFAMGVTLWSDFPIDSWRCIISNGVASTTPEGWGLYAKKLSTGEVKFMWSTILRQNTQTVQYTLNQYEASPSSYTGSGYKRATSHVMQTTLVDNNVAILFKVSPSTEYRGETDVKVFINDFIAPALELVYDNRYFADNFSALQEGAPWTDDVSNIWDKGTVDLANASRTTVLGRALHSTGINQHADEGYHNGFFGIYSFMKIFYGLTDASMDSLLYAEIQDSFSQFEQPTLSFTNPPEDNYVHNDGFINLAGEFSNLQTLTVNGSPATLSQDGTWSLDSFPLRTDKNALIFTGGVPRPNLLSARPNGGTVTVEAWITPDSLPDTVTTQLGGEFMRRTIYRHYVSSGVWHALQLLSELDVDGNPTGRAGLRFVENYNPNNVDLVVYSDEIQVGKYNHVVVSSTVGGKIRMFINGSLIGEADATPNNDQTEGTTILAGSVFNPPVEDRYLGEMNIKFHKRDFTNEEVTALYGSGFPSNNFDDYPTEVNTAKRTEPITEVLLEGLSPNGLLISRTISILADPDTPVLSLEHDGQSIESGSTITLIVGENPPVPKVDDGVTPVVADVEVVNAVGASTTVTYTAVDDAGNEAIPFVVTYEFVAWEVQHLEEQATLSSTAKIDAVGNLAEGTASLAQTRTRFYTTRQTVYFWARLKAGYSQGRLINSSGTQMQLGYDSTVKTSLWFPGWGRSEFFNNVIDENGVTTATRIAYNQTDKWFNIIASWIHEVDSEGNVTKDVRFWIDGQPINTGTAWRSRTLFATDTGGDFPANITMGSSAWLLDGVTITNDFIDTAEALNRLNAYRPATVRLVSDNSLHFDSAYVIQNQDFSSKYSILDFDDTPLAIDVDESVLGAFSYDIGDQYNRNVAGRIVEEPTNQHLEELGEPFSIVRSEGVLVDLGGPDLKYTTLNTAENSNGLFPISAADLEGDPRGFPGQTLFFWFKTYSNAQGRESYVNLVNMLDENGNTLSRPDNFTATLKIGDPEGGPTVESGRTTYIIGAPIGANPNRATSVYSAMLPFLSTKRSQWSSMAIAYDSINNIFKMFLDGVLIKSENMFDAPYDTNILRSLRIGRISNTSSGASWLWNEPFMMDGVSFFPYCLKEDQISNLNSSYIPSVDLVVDSETNLQVAQDTYDISGLAPTGYKVYANGVEIATAANNGFWSATLDLVQQSVNNITISASSVDGLSDASNEVSLVIENINPDTTSPSLTLTDLETSVEIADGSSVYIGQNEVFEQKFAIASLDSRDGDLTSQIVISPAIDTSALGETTYTATVTDAAGNQTTFTFILEVLPTSDSGRLYQEIFDAVGTTSTATGSPLMQYGILQLDGNSYLTDSRTEYLYDNAFTFSTWIKNEATDSTSRWIGTFNTHPYVSMGGESPNGVGLFITDTKVGVVGHYYDELSFTVGSTNDGSWHHLAFTITNNNTLELYFDGIPAGSKSMDGVWRGKVRGLEVGRSNKSGAAMFIGHLTNGYVFDRVLTEEEVSNLHSLGKFADPTGDIASPSLTMTHIETSSNIIEGSSILILQNETFGDKFSFTSSDNVDGDLSNQVVITPPVNTSVLGETNHTATVTDDAGNQTTFTFTLNVSDGSHEPGIEDLATTTMNGGATLLDGVLTLAAQGEYAESNSNHHDGATEQTISTWINASQLGTISNLTSDSSWNTGGHTVLITRNYSALSRANGFTLHVSSNAVRYSGPHQSNTTSNVSAEIATNRWYKFDVVWGSNYQKLYINGELAHTASPSGSIVGGATNLYIGQNVNGNNMQFFGQIDGVTVENVAKTDEQIYSSYINGLWRESSTPTTIVDSTAQTFVRANGDFTNLGDNVDYDRSYGEDFAVELDVNFASIPSSAYDIIGKGSSNPWKGWAILAYAPSGVPTLRMWANTNAAVNATLGMDAPTPIVTNQWYTIKAVWKSSGAQEFWVDGVKVAERSMGVSYLPPVDSAYDLKIGGAFTELAGRTFDGQIRNVTFYKGSV